MYLKETQPSDFLLGLKKLNESAMRFISEEHRLADIPVFQLPMAKPIVDALKNPEAAPRRSWFARQHLEFALLMKTAPRSVLSFHVHEDLYAPWLVHDSFVYVQGIGDKSG